MLWGPPHPRLSPNCASPPHPRVQATAGVAVSARRKSLERSPNPSPQPLCISDFGAAPSPTSPCLTAPQFFLRFALVLQPSIFASLFVLLLGGLGVKLRSHPFPFLSSPAPTTSLFIAVGGPRICASYAVPPAPRGAWSCTPEFAAAAYLRGVSLATLAFAPRALEYVGRLHRAAPRLLRSPPPRAGLAPRRQDGHPEREEELRAGG